MTTSTPLAPDAPRLADGVELLGEYEDSGFKEPPRLVRRGDGRLLQVAPLLYEIADRLDGERGYDELAEGVGAAVHRRLHPEDVRFLVDEKLRPLGVVEGSAPAAPAGAARAPDPLLALKYRTAVVPPDLVRVVAAIFSPLFRTPVVLGVVGALAALDVWLFTVHGVAAGVRDVLFTPANILVLLGLISLSAVFHECGHAAGTRAGGADPGAMGAGLYLVWPAFYTDITDSYRLHRRGRLRADVGGVYFNAIFVLLTAGAYFLTGFEPLLLLIPLQHIEIVHQLLPFLRLDGYYIVSDLAGVPDIYARIKPVLKSLVPGTRPDPRVEELKPWARRVVSVYVLALVPVVVLMFVLMTISAPRVFATAWDAFFLQWHRTQLAVDRREALASVVAAVQLVVLVLPPVGLALTLWRTGRRVSGGVWRATERRPKARNVLVAAVSSTATALVVAWWTGGDYQPIQPGERGTMQAGFAFMAHPRRRGHRSRAPVPATTTRPGRAPEARRGTTTTVTPRDSSTARRTTGGRRSVTTVQSQTATTPQPATTTVAATPATTTVATTTVATTTVATTTVATTTASTTTTTTTTTP